MGVEFKAGDTLECVNNNTVTHLLTLGNLYSVVRNNPTYVTVMDDRQEPSDFFHRRFEKVEDRQITEEFGLTATQELICKVCDEIKIILLDKNRKYGDSAINPKRVFSKLSPIEQINVRLDDKISRIESAQDDDLEDAELDLVGYLVLKRVAKLVQNA